MGLELELNFDADNPLTNPVPYDQPAETITVTFPIPATSTLATGATMVASGFMTTFGYGVPLEDKMPVTAVVKFSGPITFSV